MYIYIIESDSVLSCDPFPQLIPIKEAKGVHGKWNKHEYENGSFSLSFNHVACDDHHHDSFVNLFDFDKKGEEKGEKEDGEKEDGEKEDGEKEDGEKEEKTCECEVIPYYLSSSGCQHIVWAMPFNNEDIPLITRVNNNQDMYQLPCNNVLSNEFIHCRFIHTIDP